MSTNSSEDKASIKRKAPISLPSLSSGLDSLLYATRLEHVDLHPTTMNNHQLAAESREMLQRALLNTQSRLNTQSPADTCYNNDLGLPPQPQTLPPDVVMMRSKTRSPT